MKPFQLVLVMPIAIVVGAAADTKKPVAKWTCADFLGVEDDAEMQFFPGMRVPREEKLAFVDEVLEYLTARYRVMPLAAHAAYVRQHLGISIPTPPVPDAIPEADGQPLVSDLVS